MPAVEEAFSDAHMARTHSIFVHLCMVGQFNVIKVIKEVDVQRLGYHK